SPQVVIKDDKQLNAITKVPYFSSHLPNLKGSLLLKVIQLLLREMPLSRPITAHIYSVIAPVNSIGRPDLLNSVRNLLQFDYIYLQLFLRLPLSVSCLSLPTCHQSLRAEPNHFYCKTINYRGK